MTTLIFLGIRLKNFFVLAGSIIAAKRMTYEKSNEKRAVVSFIEKGVSVAIFDILYLW